MDAPTPLPTVDLDFTFFIPRQGTIRDYEMFLFSEPLLSEYITLTPPLRINGEEFHAFYECKVTTWQRLMEIESLLRSAAWVGVVRDSLPDADTSLAAPPGGSHQFPLFILESLPGSIGFDPDIHTPMNVVFACCKPCKLDVAQRRVKKGDVSTSSLSVEY
ncbi:hypothetical protein NLJ89_g9516 [Agrocybe chaxingu]|uniref:Uncharacterized protein n=1 Tax=Agrocybe chaxingu TaxID=84603 RepID=A0A9W8MTH1_9AGAR|nr:hypothetical protein NLJ89_g9516 [Agrocybe chaxingu]